MKDFRMSDPNNGGARASIGGYAVAGSEFDTVLMSSLIAPVSSSLSLPGTESVLEFRNVFGSRVSNFTIPDPCGLGMDLTDNDSDDSVVADGNKLQHGGRKRLSEYQVDCLEKWFNVDSKLEPRRKNQLAKELGLTPKQVAIWFQNRRARHKNKQIENDYDKVAEQYGVIKAQYDKVINENKKLKAEMKSMKEEMSMLKDNLLNYERLMKAGRLDPQIMQTKPHSTEAQEELQLMQQAYNNYNELHNVFNRRMIEQQVQLQKVISSASSVFDSNSPVVTSMSWPLDFGHVDNCYPVVELAETRNTNFMQVDQENSVNQEPPNYLPNFFDLDDQNCFYSFQFDGPLATACDFGVIPAADDPFWQFEL